MVLKTTVRVLPPPPFALFAISATVAFASLTARILINTSAPEAITTAPTPLDLFEPGSEALYTASAERRG
jgi:hypothetical protein